MVSYIKRSSYLKLPAAFYEVIEPTPVAQPVLVQFNQELASFLFQTNDLTPYTEEEILAVYAGNQVPAHLQSIALAYAGHQFGHYVPLLGDGRALLLGEICTPDGQCWDVQLKGSGRTRFSRMGDGRAPLAAVLREYLISEAMYGLHIPTTRCLAAIATEDKLYRQEGLVPAGVLTRIAASSLRVGTFEYAAHQGHHLLQCLADYTLERHFPEFLALENPYLELFKEVSERQARLMADWLGVGFIHGVMNTDNMTISGETLDYGPCAFMDAFDFNKVFSSIDMAGRYAFKNQPAIAHWNLTRLAETLAPLFADPAPLQELLSTFPARFHYYWNKKIRAKLGLLDDNQQSKVLIESFFNLLQEHQPDFTNTFRLMSQALDSQPHQTILHELLGNQANSAQWISDWVNYVSTQNTDLHALKMQMNQVNPAYIPRNHLVEKAIKDFIEKQDRRLMDALLSALNNPYQEQKDTDHLQQPPLPHECVLQTFCGT